MTIHFSQFDDNPSALDDLCLSQAEKIRLEALKELTGCTLARVIDGVCQDPECQNRGQLINTLILADVNCPSGEANRAAGQAESNEPASEQPESQSDSLSRGIFQTDNRLRCVL